MAYEHDFWMWETPQLNLDQIKQMNKIINERSIGVEETKYSARSGDGRLLKNIKPLRISMKHLMDTPIDDLIHTAEKTINTEYGYHIYPINKWDQLLHNRYSSDIQGYYGVHADGSRSDIYDIKMTLLINLSEGDYGGGDLIINGKTGYLCDGNDLSALYKTLLKILENENFKELGKNAYEFSKNFNWNKIVKKYIKLI